MSVKQTYRVGMGASSLLMILVILSLTTLGVLALTSALADWRLSEKAAETAEAYYSAASDAQETIARIDEALAKAKGEASDAADYLRHVAAISLRDVRNEDGAFSFQEDAGDGFKLSVTVEATPYDNRERYRVTQHELTDEREWNAEGAYDLFGTN